MFQEHCVSPKDVRPMTKAASFGGCDLVLSPSVCCGTRATAGVGVLARKQWNCSRLKVSEPELCGYIEQGRMLPFLVDIGMAIPVLCIS
eukprot:12046271-Alexandrium_andersonii.AAC.1